MASKFLTSKELQNITLNSKTPHFRVREKREREEGRRKKKRKRTRTVRKEYRNEDVRTGDVNS